MGITIGAAYMRVPPRGIPPPLGRDRIGAERRMPPPPARPPERPAYAGVGSKSDAPKAAAAADFTAALA
jgi:hypothetical protein